jgi:glycosyltransferase involved in cell wall biosynthesis
MKIALVSTSLGYSHRGIERFTLELFKHVKDQLPITLFGTRLNRRPNEVSLPCLKFDGVLSKLKGKRRDNYYFQQFTYALSFIPLIVSRGYDVIHYSEPAIGHFLFHARRLFKLKYKLVFTDGLGLYPHLDPLFFERRDYIQTITMPHYDRMIHSGAKKERVTFLPYGVDAKQYQTTEDKKALRKKYGIPQDKKVIVTVAALNRRHKRIDYLIREISQLSEEYFFLVVGQPEEPDLIDYGRQLLGDRFKSLYVPFDEVAKLYHVGDLFVFPCVIGEFGLALAEAMCAGIPVIAHEYFEWMVEEPKCLVNQEDEGALRRKIEEVGAHRAEYDQIAQYCQKRAVERFDWAHLVPRYLDMYQHVKALSN